MAGFVSISSFFIGAEVAAGVYWVGLAKIYRELPQIEAFLLSRSQQPFLFHGYADYGGVFHAIDFIDRHGEWFVDRY